MTPPRPETHLTSPSLSDPSDLQIGSGAAITIQFPPGINGESPGGGINPAKSDGPPIQIAVPIPSVRVGVTNIRTALVNGAPSRRYHPAQIGEPGQTNGIGPNGVGRVVGAEKSGSPVDGAIIPSGNPKSVGALPGASGAQLSGELRHDPQPNPQESPSAIF